MFLSVNKLVPNSKDTHLYFCSHIRDFFKKCNKKPLLQLHKRLPEFYDWTSLFPKQAIRGSITLHSCRTRSHLLKYDRRTLQGFINNSWGLCVTWLMGAYESHLQKKCVSLFYQTIHTCTHNNTAFAVYINALWLGQRDVITLPVNDVYNVLTRRVTDLL